MDKSSQKFTQYFIHTPFYLNSNAHFLSQWLNSIALLLTLSLRGINWAFYILNNEIFLSYFMGLFYTTGESYPSISLVEVYHAWKFWLTYKLPFFSYFSQSRPLKNFFSRLIFFITDHKHKQQSMSLQNTLNMAGLKKDNSLFSSNFRLFPISQLYKSVLRYLPDYHVINI